MSIPKINPFNGLILFVGIYIAGSIAAVLSDNYVSHQTDEIWFWMVSILIGLWVFNDKKQYNYHAPFDYGAYIIFAWPLVLPVYLAQTRGKKALLGILAVFLIYLLPSIFWYIIDSYIWAD